MSTTTWTFRDRRGELIRNATLQLSWEAAGDPISDDYKPDETDAQDLLRLWWDRYGREAGPRLNLAEGFVPIYWSVDVSGPDRITFEWAPDAYWWPGTEPREDFSTFFSWPESEETGEPLRWPELPVRDKLWNSEHADKGGFLQEATGWKPSAYQPVFHAPLLASAAGITLR